MTFRAVIFVAALLAALNQPAAAQLDGTARAHFIPVTKGDATLIEFPCGAMLIDTAKNNSEAAVTDYLRSFFESRPDLNHTLDLVVLTHIHGDHVGNFIAIAEEFGVLGVVHNGRDQGPQRAVLDWLDQRPQIRQFAARVEDIPAGGLTNASIDPFACDSVDPVLTVLWGGMSEKPPGWDRKAFRDRNNHSVTVRIDYGEGSMLFTGDLEKRGIESLLEKHGPAALDVDLFKIGHHGFPSGTTEELVEAVTPEIAVLSRPGDRRWSVGDYDLYTRLVERPRDPLPIPLFDAGPGGFPEKAERYDEDDNPTVLGVEEGEFNTATLDKAIYWAGLEGAVVVSVAADGALSVEE